MEFPSSRCLRYLSRNAYIVTAMYGSSFCPAAKDAFYLLYKNVVRIEVLSKVTKFILFVSKLVIVGVAVTLAHILFT